MSFHSPCDKLWLNAKIKLSGTQSHLLQEAEKTFHMRQTAPKILQFRLDIFFKLGLERELIVWMSPNDILSFVVHMFLSNVPCDISYKTNVYTSPQFEILILNNNVVYSFLFSYHVSKRIMLSCNILATRDQNT